VPLEPPVVLVTPPVYRCGTPGAPPDKMVPTKPPVPVIPPVL
jgi:hypothetical protein